MHRILLGFAIVMLVTTTGYSQTKKIAHRSHSGKDADLAMEEDGNFGLDEQGQKRMDSLRKAKRQQQDSVKIATYRDSLNKARVQPKPKKAGSKK